MAQSVDVDNAISRLLNVGTTGGRLTTQVSEQELQQHGQKAKDVFQSQSSLIEVESPLVVCGDTHGLAIGQSKSGGMLDGFKKVVTWVGGLFANAFNGTKSTGDKTKRLVAGMDNGSSDSSGSSEHGSRPPTPLFLNAPAGVLLRNYLGVMYAPKSAVSGPYSTYWVAVVQPVEEDAPVDPELLPRLNGVMECPIAPPPREFPIDQTAAAGFYDAYWRQCLHPGGGVGGQEIEISTTEEGSSGPQSVESKEEEAGVVIGEHSAASKQEEKPKEEPSVVGDEHSAGNLKEEKKEAAGVVVGDGTVGTSKEKEKKPEEIEQKADSSAERKRPHGTGVDDEHLPKRGNKEQNPPAS